MRSKGSPGGRGPRADRPPAKSGCAFLSSRQSPEPPTPVNLLLGSKPAASAGMRKSERAGGVRGGEAAGRGPHVPGVAPTCPSSAYPGGESALGLAAPAGSPSGAARAWGPRKEAAAAAAGRGRSGSECGADGLRTGGRAVSPGRAGQRRAMSQRGRREARGARWPGRGGAAFPAAAALAWAARGLGEGPAAGRRPRAAATGGPTGGQGRGSCQRVAGPLRWRNLLFLPRLAGALLCLSVLLTLSLPGWKFPLTSSEKTDRRTHARTPRGREVGRHRGWGKPALVGLPCAPGSAPPPSSAPAPRGRLGEENAARGRRPGRRSPLQSSRSRSPEAAADGDAPRSASGARLPRGAGGGVWLLDSCGPEPPRTGPSIWRG